MSHFWMEVPSPIGRILLEANGSALTRVELPPAVARPKGLPRPNAVLRAAARQLQEYFAGKRRVFHLPLAPAGTSFQKRVWKALAAVPFGQTRSYGEIARAIGKPLAARAVGGACGRNPLAIVVPCHRVIGSTGSLTGFGAGLHRKKWLLAHEGVDLP